MKNLLLKLRKAEGFISIETIMVGSIMVLVCLVAYNVLYATTLEGKANAARGYLTDKTPVVEELFDDMILDLGD